MQNADAANLIQTIALQLPRLDAQREGIDMYGAPRFSEFELCQPNELAMSRIIAELLDPRGHHGQGTLFLNALLRALGLPPVRVHGGVRVVREAPTSIGRRIDLVIETADVLLGVENKPSAVQRPNQLAHYLDELHRTAGRKEPRLVFLSDQKPRSAEDQVVCMQFAAGGTGLSLTSVLRAALPKVHAPRVRDFLANFIAYLDEHFGDGSVLSSSNEPYVQAVEVEFDLGPERRRAIAAIYLAHEQIYERCLAEIETVLTEKLQRYAADLELVTEGSLLDLLNERQALWGVRRPHWPANCAVGVMSEGELDDIYYGIWAPSSGELTCPRRAALEAAASKVPNGRRSKEWPWWQSAEPNSLDLNIVAQLILETPNGQVAEHKDVEILATSLVALAEAVDAQFSAKSGR